MFFIGLFGNEVVGRGGFFFIGGGGLILFYISFLGVLVGVFRSVV